MTEDIVSRFATGELSIEFWRGLSEGRLLIPRCQSCDRSFFFPRRWCPFCWSERVKFVESAGTGEIFALSELYTAFQGISADELPVAVILVELDEGVRLPGRLAKECLPAGVGDRVKIRYASDPRTELPQFITEVEHAIGRAS